MKELIKELVEAYGPSGHEDRIREIIKAKIEDKVDELRTDSLGNLIALKKGKDSSKRVMLAAHMDEIGLIATHIDDDGFIRFSNVGGLSPYMLLGARVLFNGETIGVIDKEGKLDDISKLKHEKLYADIGATNKEEAAAKVKVGDTASYYRQMDDLGDKLVSKAMDDRIGCVVLLETLNRLESIPTYDTYFVFTVQEEVGLRGAKTSSFGINPDLGIAVDVTLTGDMPEARRMEVGLGKGPAIKIKDSSVLVHPQVKNLMIDIAEENNIPYQLEVLVSGGTDAGAIHLTREGIPSGALSIPCRYVHSPSEMVDINDVDNSIKLLTQLLESSYTGLFE
ncbi:endoglucanase [Orenia metallireducens]|uniref:Endoglucanase n=1 Tax=Orenia metallireducens TaxID=1413210 RepID=A0A285F5J6_9FIRM|nr:M42 family metallopeptidase [Orenia metallireducens]PRX34874.1 endoglucanase [Orenia metallireducens]SNY05984.1 endoglucanase [Orenia metallireducens]